MSWIDYSQNARIRELQEDLSDTHSQMARERRRMRSELGRIRGTLEQRLDRVSATLDAFIELSDVRATLAMFDDAAIARHRTLQMLTGTAPADPGLEDVPGYWLVPAARGLHALLDDDLARARPCFDEAAAIDPERARCFAALASALTRAEHARTLGEDVSADLLPHLPGPRVQLTRGRRALWLLTADGSFGDDAREHLLLSTLRRWTAEGVRLSPAHDWVAVPAVSGRGRGAAASAASQRQAAQALARLRERVAEVTALGTEDTSSEAMAPDEASSDFLRETLRLLVEEGSPEEAPLLAESNRLRAVVENGGRESALPAWGDTVDSVEALLRQDLTREDVPPHRRTFALVLQRAAVMDTAEDLAARATTLVPETSSTTFQGLSITVTESGADQRQVERARRRLRERHGADRGHHGLLWASLATAVVLLVLSLLTANAFLWILTLGAAVATGIAYTSSERARKDGDAVLSSQTRGLDQQVARAVEKLRRARTESEELASAAGSDLERLRSLLAP
ncbi:hypothetical protein ACWFMI_26430 [Nocardiopsis terrae]